MILLGSESLESGTFDLLCTITSHEISCNVCFIYCSLQVTKVYRNCEFLCGLSISRAVGEVEVLPEYSEVGEVCVLS